MITFLLFIPLLAGSDGQREVGCRVGNQFHKMNTRFIYTEGCVKKTCYCLQYSNQPKLLCPEQYKRKICAEGRESQTHSRSVGQSALTVVRKNHGTGTSEVTVEQKRTNTNERSRNVGRTQGTEGSTRTEDVSRRKKSRRKDRGKENRARRPKQNGNARRGSSPERKDHTSHCSVCVVKDREYPGHSRFRYREECKQFHCVCKCDGSWNCPAQYTRDVCQSTSVDSRPRCKSCKVKGKTYEGNSYFNMKDGCYEYRGCTCACDGAWKCYDDRSVNVCTEEKETNQTKGCKECNVFGTTYPGRSRFTYTQGCYQFSCDCKCDGTWDCPKERTTETCSHGCRECVVESKRYKGNTTNKIRYGCYEHLCNCSCDGQYGCDSGTFVCTSSDRRSSCRNCVDNKGLVREGNTSFVRTEDCDEFTCTCDCRGQTTCTRTRNLCSDTTSTDESEKQTCQPCTDWESRQHPGNTTFMIKRGHCHEYHCRCDCDGTYECPSDQIKNICHKPETCRSCKVNGEEYASKTSFELKRGCRMYSCECQCSGTYRCNTTKWRDVCGNTTEPTETTTPGACKSCNLLGNTYKGNTNFKLKRGCYEFPCKCDCLGRWQCFRDRVEYICDKSDTEKERRCKRCVINGTEYTGNTRFKRDKDCFRYTCTCNCDGSWDCPVSTAVRICRADKDHTKACKTCTAYGSRYQGNSTFYSERNCYKYTCQCRCDGSWECPSNTARFICDRGHSADNRTTCGTCNINGTTYDGNTDFRRDIGCYRYSCRCNCNGSWDCPGSKAVPNGKCRDTTKPCRTCVVDNRVYQAEAQFYFERDCKRYTCKCNCDGSFECPVAGAVNTCDKDSGPSTDTAKCRQCELEGKRYRPNERFQYDHNCFRYQCHCHCNGTIDCPGGTAVNICPDKCFDCEINGTTYRTESDFHLEKDCLRYKCHCNCDGSWRCPGDDTVHICPDQCADCNVNGTVYRSESTFQMDQDCYRYNCNCRCNGSWDCPGSSAVNICPNKCFTCDVNGTSHQPNTRFQLDKDCYRYQCTCNCDGSWECPGSRATYICSRPTLPPVGGCRQCEFKGNSFAANTDFNVQDGCLAYACRCTCRGESKCRITNICTERKEEKPPCKQCEVDGEKYNGETNFQRVQNCRQFDCRCHCDGRWTCDAATAKYICGTDSKDGCQRCSVHGRWYAPRSRFLVRDGCFQYTCECRCDGQASCPQNTAVDVCAGDDTRPTTRCRSCKVNEQEFPGNSKFEYVIGCYKYDCECDCNGRHVCPQHKAVYICGSENRDNRPTTDYTDNRGCRPCHHDGKRYPGGKAFMYQDRCFQFTCYCKCDGSYQCPAHLTKNMCKDGSGGNRPIPGNTELARCSQCVIHGQALAPMKTFIMRKGCIEHLCECKCDGTWQCPEDRSVNICDTPGYTNSREHGPSYKTKGCKEGDKTHYTRLFAKREGCIQYSCVCHENGHYTCPQSTATKIC